MLTTLNELLAAAEPQTPGEAFQVIRAALVLAAAVGVPSQDLVFAVPCRLSALSGVVVPPARIVMDPLATRMSIEVPR